jgi:hypothetical protein
LRQKWGVFFVLDREYISKSVKCFLSQNGQRGSLLVFYIGNILVDKNTLCNACVLTGWSFFNSESSCIQTMIKSKTINDYKLLKDVLEESLQNPRQKQSVPVQPSGRAFEGVWTLLSVQQITMKTSGRQSNTVWTLGQLVFNKEFDFRSRHCLGSLCKSSGRRGNTSRRCPAFQNIPEFRSNAERILVKTVRT